jgi:hypothetical protein
MIAERVDIALRRFEAGETTDEARGHDGHSSGNEAVSKTPS